MWVSSISCRRDSVSARNIPPFRKITIPKPMRTMSSQRGWWASPQYSIFSMTFITRSPFRLHNKKARFLFEKKRAPLFCFTVNRSFLHIHHFLYGFDHALHTGEGLLKQGRGIGTRKDRKRTRRTSSH